MSFFKDTINPNSRQNTNSSEKLQELDQNRRKSLTKRLSQRLSGANVNEEIIELVKTFFDINEKFILELENKKFMQYIVRLSMHFELFEFEEWLYHIAKKCFDLDNPEFIFCEESIEMIILLEFISCAFKCKKIPILDKKSEEQKLLDVFYFYSNCPTIVTKVMKYLFEIGNQKGENLGYIALISLLIFNHYESMGVNTKKFFNIKDPKQITQDFSSDKTGTNITMLVNGIILIDYEIQNSYKMDDTKLVKTVRKFIKKIQFPCTNLIFSVKEKEMIEEINSLQLYKAKDFPSSIEDDEKHPVSKKTTPKFLKLFITKKPISTGLSALQPKQSLVAHQPVRANAQVSPRDRVPPKKLGIDSEDSHSPKFVLGGLSSNPSSPQMNRSNSEKKNASFILFGNNKKSNSFNSNLNSK